MTGFLLAVSLAQAAAPAACPIDIVLQLGQPVDLRTEEALSTKTHAKGDLVRLSVAHDVVLNGQVAIAEGTPATGQIADAQATGGMGTNGKLFLVPLYIKVGNRVVRLSGQSSRERGMSAALVAGMVLVTPLFSGRSATIASGAPLPAVIAKTTTIVANC